MTPEQITLIRNSFAKLLPCKAQAAELFYCRLFELDPSLRLMFKSDMSEQKEKLMVALALVVANLEKMESLRPAMLELGRRHTSYGVQKRHYDVVGAALLWTLEIGIGGGWNPALATAWREAYGVLAGIMIEGADMPEPKRPARPAAA
jgi:nitric oxide dioxygenase